MSTLSGEDHVSANAPPRLSFNVMRRNNMKYFDETRRGFFWGLGFSLVSILVFTIYMYFIYAKIESRYRLDLVDIFDNKISEALDKFEPQVIGFKVINGKVVISSRAINGNSSGFNIYLRFTLTSSKKPKYASTCTQPLVHESGGRKYVYYQTECRSMFFKSEDIDKVDVGLVMDFRGS